MSIRLTQTVKKGGCAAKVAASELRKILAQVQFPPRGPQVLVDGSKFDDAAVFQISPELALVQTLDFFTPIVDTPSVFGQVAAANAISDVYAMGGTPQTAMAILAFPVGELSNEIIAEVLQGASEVMKKAGVSFVGGHSIDDDTLKFGLSVTGTVHPKEIWANGRAKAGEVLILTKALGTGSFAAALKRSEITEGDMAEALASMVSLNNILDLINDTDRKAISAATDITGFGLLGHAYNLAEASGVALEIDIHSVPRLEKVEALLEKGFLTKAHHSNRHYVESSTQWGELSEIEQLLLLDPQTSGGLLMSLPPEAAERILPALRSRFSKAAVIGRVVEQQPEQARIRCR